MIRRLALAAAVALSAGYANAANLRPTVLELFTSQGCSSCPPADALLAELSGRKDVIALGFHVDYWDRLGWKDPLSTPGATARQRNYSKIFGRNEIYTPQLVVDGAQSMVGSDRDKVLGALREGSPIAQAPVIFAPDAKSVTVDAGQGQGAVLLVRFVERRETRVKAGENTGHAADDVNAVTELTSLGDWMGSPTRFKIPTLATGEGLAVLVQSPEGRIVGAGLLGAKIRIMP